MKGELKIDYKIIYPSRLSRNVCLCAWKLVDINRKCSD